MDANQIQEDLNKLLLSLEHLSVEALREVSDRTLTLIAEKTGEAKRSLIGGVIGGALSIGESISGLFSRSDGDAPKEAAGKEGAGLDGGAAAQSVAQSGQRQFIVATITILTRCPRKRILGDYPVAPPVTPQVPLLSSHAV